MKLNIEIEAEDQESLEKLLRHVSKEVREGKGFDDVESHIKPKDMKWMVIETSKIKGKYRWNRS